MVGTVVNDGIKVSDRLTIPNELIKGNLKEFIVLGDKVRLIRNHGGQEFYIVEIIGVPNILDKMFRNRANNSKRDGMTITNLKIKEVRR